MKKMIILLILLMESFLFAQAFKNPPESSSSLSQAGAFVAQCDDPSATTINPAGLVQIKGEEILFGLTSVYSNTEYKDGDFSAEKSMFYLYCLIFILFLI